jgi:hypothetical protein
MYYSGLRTSDEERNYAKDREWMDGWIGIQFRTSTMYIHTYKPLQFPGPLQDLDQEQQQVEEGGKSKP